MYDNVPQKFIPDTRPDLFYAHPRFHYVHNNDELNATYEFLGRGIEENDWGDNTALISPDTGETLTYNDLRRRVNEFAGALRDLGVEPGDRVLWRFSNVPRAVITHLAVWKIGAVVVSTAMQERARELEFFIEDTEATAVVTMGDMFEEVETALDNTDHVEEVIVSGDDAHGYHAFGELLERADEFTGHAGTDPFDVATIMYTSGTTGRPKGCVHTHAEEVANADAEAGEGRALTPADTQFSPVPVGHGMGNVLNIKLPFRYGASVVLASRPAPEELLDIVETHDVTIFDALGTIIRMVLNEEDVDEYDLSSLRLTFAPIIDAELNDRWVEATGNELLNSFGMCPLGGYILVPHRNGEKFAPDASIGRGLSGYETKVVDVNDPGEEVARGETGRLLMRGPTGILYWNNAHPDMPEKMDEDTLDGWSVLDDAFYQTEDGYLYHVARTDDMIESAGRQISPTEVEEVLNRHEAVAEIAVVGKPHDVRGEIVKSFVELVDTAEASDDLREEIKEYAKNEMAMYKYPREIEFIDEIPITPQGKIQRRELQEREQEAQSEGTTQA